MFFHFGFTPIVGKCTSNLFPVRLLLSTKQPLDFNADNHVSSWFEGHDGPHQPARKLCRPMTYVITKSCAFATYYKATIYYSFQTRKKKEFTHFAPSFCILVNVYIIMLMICNYIDKMTCGVNNNVMGTDVEALCGLVEWWVAIKKITRKQNGVLTCLVII